MWICIVHRRAVPISANAEEGRTTFSRKAGMDSKNPMKNATAPGRMYDVLMTCVENCSVHGAVNSHPQMSHRGTDGRRLQRYQASAASARDERTPSRTIGDSGIGSTLKGTPTRRPWSAPGISLFVQTTSAPKNGHRPVA